MFIVKDLVYNVHGTAVVSVFVMPIRPRTGLSGVHFSM